MIARIKWLNVRKSIPPAGTRYCPLIVFPSDTNITTSTWSSDIHIITNDYSHSLSIADVEYLVSNAPAYNIHQGNSFELYEGARKVADGIFITKD